MVTDTSSGPSYMSRQKHRKQRTRKLIDVDDLCPLWSVLRFDSAFTGNLSTVLTAGGRGIAVMYTVNEQREGQNRTEETMDIRHITLNDQLRLCGVEHRRHVSNSAIAYDHSSAQLSSQPILG